MNNTELTEGIFDDLNDPAAIPRKKMLPGWIKVFCWIFLVLGILAPISAAVMLFLSRGAGISLYGFSTNDVLSPIGIAGICLYLFKALVGYGLLTEKDWAVNCAIIDGWVGVLLCVVAMFTGVFITRYQIGDVSGFRMRLELFLIIPFLVKMYRIKGAWRQNVYARRLATS